MGRTVGLIDIDGGCIARRNLYGRPMGLPLSAGQALLTPAAVSFTGWCAKHARGWWW
jgi:hypothetical protein